MRGVRRGTRLRLEAGHARLLLHMINKSRLVIVRVFDQGGGGEVKVQLRLCDVG